jgi:hypothetical protein
MKLLNILNGDSSMHLFRRANLEGEILVWRETLSEGPVSNTNSYEDFFVIRFAWISKAYNSPFMDYKEKVIDEFSVLENTDEFNEIVLWFEFDLHCQINLIFILNYFHNKGLKDTKLFLICPDSHTNHPDFRGIGELSPQEFAELPQQRILLDRNDLAIASKAWESYCSGNPELITELISLDHGHLDKLKPALLAHLNRFADEKTGLNSIEEKLLDIINSGITERTKIYHEFWRLNSIYGMGDSQIDIYIKSLAELNLIPQNLK